jgi:hypothetical protein
MTESKKAWVEPELIALVRSKPEEGVLSVCKSWSPSAGPNNLDGICGDLTCGAVCFFPTDS